MGLSLKIFALGIPHMLMYSALHTMQWFSPSLEVFSPKIRQNFFDFRILIIKTNVAYTRFKVIASAVYFYGLVQLTVMTGFNFQSCER